MNLKKVSILKTIITIALSATFLMSAIISAFGYSLHGAKWKNNSVVFYYDSYNSSKGKNCFDKSASIWKSAGSKLNITKSANGFGVYMTEISEKNVTWLGITARTVSGGYYTKCISNINIAKDNPYNDNHLLAVTIHEMGHALGFDHSNVQAVMQSMMSTPFVTLQPDDISGIKAIYK